MQKTENVISKSIFSTSALFHLPSSLFHLISDILHQPSYISPQPSPLFPDNYSDQCLTEFKGLSA